jgi:hypothetical protein
MLSHDEVIARLDEAGMTLLSLPRERAIGHIRSSCWQHVEPAVRDMDFTGRPLCITATPAEIARMDEAMAWLALIPQDKFVLRRIVGARAMVSPITGRHLFPWRRIATLMGADHKAIQRWHAQGIGIIAQAINQTSAMPKRRAA